MGDLPTKDQKSKVFPSSTDCRAWAEKTFANEPSERGKYEVRCRNAAQYDGDGRNIKVIFDAAGGLDRLQVIDSSNGDVLYEP